MTLVSKIPAVPLIRTEFGRCILTSFSSSSTSGSFSGLESSGEDGLEDGEDAVEHLEGVAPELKKNIIACYIAFLDSLCAAIFYNNSYKPLVSITLTYKFVFHEYVTCN
jgi:hypothetical protein